MVDIESVKQAFSTLAAALAVIKQARDLLPAGSGRDELGKAVEQAERQLKMAESQAAHGLGYELCRAHFPPEVMTSRDDRNWICPVCNNEKFTGPWGRSVRPW